MPTLTLVAALALAGLPAPATATQLSQARPKPAQARKVPVAATTQLGMDSAAVQEMLKNSASVYEVLVGYMHLHRGNPADAYAYMLDAATRMKDERLYLLATEIALHSRSFDATQKALEKWQAALPQDAKAREYYLRLLIASGRLAQSAQPLREILALADTPRKQGLLHDIPSLYETAKKPQQALAATQPVLEAAMQQPATAFIAASSLARMQIAAGKYTEVLRALEMAVQTQPPEDALGDLPNRELPGLIAMDLIQATQRKDPATMERAHTLVRQSLQQGKASSPFLLAYARTLIAAKRYDVALQTLDQLLKQEPGHDAALALKGAVLLETKHTKAAEATLEEYLRQRKVPDTPTITPPATGTGTAAAANAQVMELLRQAETDANVHAMLARIADERGDAQAASQWISRMPPATRRQATMQRIEWLLRQDKHDQALQVLGTLPAPANPQERTQHALVAAHIHDKRQDRAQAVRVLDEALRFDKDNPELLYSRGLTLDQLGRYAEAERDYRQVMRLKPDSAAAYNAMGYGLADRKERLKEA
ncbi:MAG: tetratricopeptide repeat protein, partial [Brachymonas sp.]|nr:tetratricopeptide repeat protein [Brachymonas sp.]